MRFPFPIVPVVLLCAALAGCGRSSIYDKTVDAGSPMGYSMWRSATGRALSSEEVQMLDRAIQEKKYRIMSDGEASGSQAVDEALRRQIDGATLYEVVNSGLQARLNRLLDERSVLEEIVQKNSRLRTRPGDAESAQALAGIRKTQAERVEKNARDIDEVMEDLRILKMKARGN